MSSPGLTRRSIFCGFLDRRVEPGDDNRAAVETNWLEQRPHLPQLGEEDDVEGLAQLADAGGAAGAALVADDPLHRLDVAEAPLLEGILEVDPLLGQLVEVPVAAGVAIDREPGVAHRRITAIGRRPVPG